VKAESTSVRLSDSLRHRLRAAAKATGVSESELIRAAITTRCDEVLADRLDVRLADVIGSVSIGGGYSRRTHEAFTELLERRRQRTRSDLLG